MIYSMVPFTMTLSPTSPRVQGHRVTVDAVDILCAQLTRDLIAIGKFLLSVSRLWSVDTCVNSHAFNLTVNTTLLILSQHLIQLTG